MRKLRADRDILLPAHVEKTHMKELLNKFFDQTFWKFILVGIVNTIFGTGIMFVFYNIFHFSYWVSSASNYFFGSILSYILNRIFTFRNNETATSTLPRFIINISLCYLLAYGIAKPLVTHILSNLSQSLQENLAMLVGMCLFVGLNYIGQRFFVFKRKKNDCV